MQNGGRKATLLSYFYPWAFTFWAQVKSQCFLAKAVAKCSYHQCFTNMHEVLHEHCLVLGPEAHGDL
jgi:hypothetical protein